MVDILSKVIIAIGREAYTVQVSKINLQVFLSPSAGLISRVEDCRVAKKFKFCVYFPTAHLLDYDYC